ncbi:hypothetical protein B0T10DRAFT_567847 [Thelonectria olida]|uniref:Uncharacterized protein n=1 Tax=Thelonectria olida TaxID=1576542 RepID=A0A9P9AIX3_9HYPO|nr:hypothetical protein B0T10DRAFT_567847 [Thelonectria olida]
MVSDRELERTRDANIAAMMYNPNNVATEASPYTASVEPSVGDELCQMLGYSPEDDVAPWGHFTCDGSIANLEAIWASKLSPSKELRSPSPSYRLAEGVIAVFEDVFENAIQPLPQELNDEGVSVVKTDPPGLSFVPDFKHKISVYSDYKGSLDGSVKPIATGDTTLTSKIFADWEMVNMDLVSERHNHEMN